MTSAKVVLISACAVLLALAGCGSKVNLRAADNPDEITPPATPGAPDALAGTCWEFADLGMLVVFSAPPSARLANPANPSEGGPAAWSCRPNGVVSVSVMGTTFAGTWDGHVVVLSGETGRRRTDLE